MMTSTDMADTGVDPRAVAITQAWMAHLGYTPEEITFGETVRDHSECDSTSEGWECEDEEGRSRHPLHDEMDVVAELVMFTLDRAGYRGAIEALQDGKQIAGWLGLKATGERSQRGAINYLKPAAEYLEAIEATK